MATTRPDLGDDDHPAVPLVAVRFDGELGAPLVVVPGAILTPDQAIEYAKAIFAAAASTCQRSRLDVAGRC